MEATKTTLIFLFTFTFYAGAQELLVNPDFENDFDGNWFCYGCTLDKSTTAYTGQYSGRVTNRYVYTHMFHLV